MPSRPGLVLGEWDALEDSLGFPQRAGGLIPKCRLGYVDLKQIDGQIFSSKDEFIQDQQRIAIQGLNHGRHVQVPTRQRKETLL